MKKVLVVLVFILCLALMGCSNNGGVDLQGELRSQSSEIGMEDHHATLQKQIDGLSGELTQLQKQNELFPTFSKLVYEFMEAIEDQDQRILKSVVSSDFVTEMVGEKWYYHAKEEVDGSNKVLLSDDKNDIDGWYINFYSIVPSSGQYGMSIRMLTEEGIKLNVPETLNIQFGEVDGHWKIVSVDRFI